MAIQFGDGLISVLDYFQPKGMILRTSHTRLRRGRRARRFLLPPPVHRVLYPFSYPDMPLRGKRGQGRWENGIHGCCDGE
jgi:hypothetical protein